MHFASQLSQYFAMSAGASGATPAAATYTKWQCPGCVFNQTCSKASWGRAKVFSWESEAACRAALLKHIMESGLHTRDVAEHSEEHIRELVRQARVDEHVYTAEEIGPWEDPNECRPQKRQHEPPDNDGQRHKRSRTASVSSGDKDAIAESLSIRLVAPTAGPELRDCKSVLDRSLATIMIGGGKADEVDDTKKVWVPAYKLDELARAVDRYNKAVTKAKNFLIQASLAWANENNAFAGTIQSMGLKLGQVGNVMDLHVRNVSFLFSELGTALG